MIKINNKIAISVATSIALGVSAYGACSANLDMGGNQIKNLATPTDNNDSVTLEYMKGYASDAIPNYGVVTDADGNIYRTKVFGSQLWMMENLRATTSPTGVATNVRECNTTEWLDSGDTCYAAASTDGDTPDVGDLNVSKGYLYQWNAAMDGSTTAGARGLCPAGWHIPTDQDWQTLEKTLSGNSTNVPDEPTYTDWRFGTNDDDSIEGGDEVGTKMKSDMNAIMVGFQKNTGLQVNVGDGMGFWSSNSYGEDDSKAFRRTLNDTRAGVLRAEFDKTSGFSIRCIRD
jgi:uncharacterized protein (TIGR02145 family)